MAVFSASVFASSTAVSRALATTGSSKSDMTRTWSEMGDDKIALSEKNQIQQDNHTLLLKAKQILLTIALYLSAMLLARVDLPDKGGPTTHTLHGMVGFGGRRKSRGERVNCLRASSDDRLYILSRNLKYKHVHALKKRTGLSATYIECENIY